MNAIRFHMGGHSLLRSTRRTNSHIASSAAGGSSTRIRGDLIETSATEKFETFDGPRELSHRGRGRGLSELRPLPAFH
eukprot:8979539-Pyramimonas_sp.AAC.1